MEDGAVVTYAVRRDLAVAVGALVAAVLLTIVALDALSWSRRLGDDDARFTGAAIRRQGLWEIGETLPFRPVERLLGLGDDIAYRRAVSAYARSDPGLPIAVNPQREAVRADARRLLTDLSKSDPDRRRRAKESMLVALLALGHGDLFTSPEERLQVLRGAVGNLQVALALDPDSDEIKRNLELALSDAGLPPEGATDPGTGYSYGSQTGAGRSGSGY
jgi:hypothetical protein